MSVPFELKEQAEAWLAADPDLETRAELEQLLAAGDAAELQSRFGDTLKFGTAGLRGELGAGPNRMNRVVVRQTTAALTDYLNELAEAANAEAANTGSVNTGSAKIIIGYDGRRNSDAFARDAAAVAAAKGAQAILLEGTVPTPVLAHAVLRHGCDAGIMITASHNPPQDNGYKVYWNDGAQIIPPHDRKIERTRHQIGLLPRDFGSDLFHTRQADEEIKQYVNSTAPRISELFEGVFQTGAEPLRVVYTPLHGVGKATLLRLFEVLGLSEPIVVPEQAEPDGDFPTVQFPNPEEPGALDLALRLAAKEDADVVLANDPDADRLCVALKQPSPAPPDSPDISASRISEAHSATVKAEPSHYRVLSGDELGCLLADGILSLVGSSAKGATGLLVGTTIVSSQLLAKIAEAHEAAFGATLTGFKWLARVGSSRPERFVFGYEEALGFSVLPDLVRDKDGITAAAVFMLLMQQWQAEGVGPLERLDELSRQHGLHKSRQISFRYEGDEAQTTTAAIMGSLRLSPPTSFAASGDLLASSQHSLPETADSPLHPSLEDISSGTEGEEANESRRRASGKESNAISSVVDYAEGTAGSVPANVLMYFLRNGARVVIRPSGTEPKLKAYLEVIEPVGDSDDPNAAIAEATDLATAQLNELEAAVRSLIDERSEG